DGGGGAGGVDGAENEVAGLGGMNGRLERMNIAQLADQNDVRVLPHRVLEGLVPVHAIQADLALVDVGLLVGVGEFDGVFDGENVQRLACVDVVEHRGDGGGFAAAGHAGEDDHALVEVAQLLDTGRQAELFERGDTRAHAAGHQGQPAACLEQADGDA